MLVATPGQTATYATGPTAKKVTTLSSSANANNLTGTSKALNSAGTTSINASSVNANNNKNLNNSKSSTGHNNSFTFNTLKNVFITNSNVRENIPTTITNTPMVAAASSIDNSSSEVIPVNSNSSKTAASSLMKSLTVRLNRGTETLKATVHKALITATAVSSIIERKTITEAITTKLATTTTTATNISNIASLKTSNVINTSASTSASSSAATLLATAHKYPSATFLKLYAVPPTIIHRLPSEREQTSSTDSLNKEMCHFKPIRTAPTTPWKSGSKSRGVSLRFPKANVATNPEFSKKSNCDVINRKEDKNRDMNHDRNPNENLKPKPSSSTLLLTRLLATPNHQSAFVCLVAQMEQLTKKHTNLDNHSPQSNVKNVSDLRKIAADFKRPGDVPSRVTRVQKRRSNSIFPNANVTNEMKLKHRPATAEVAKESIKSPHHTRIHNTRTLSRRRGGSGGIANMITNADTSAAIAAATAALNNAGIKTRTTVKVTPSASRAAAKDVNATTTTATLSIIQKPKPKILDLVKLAQHSRLQSKLPSIAAGKHTKSATISPSDSQTSSKIRRARKRKLLNDDPEPVTAVKIKVMPTRSNAGVKTSARRNASAAKVSNDRSAKNLRANSDVMFRKLREKETERRAVIGKTNPMQKKSVTSQRPSPPLTRSRLKEMQLNEAKRT
uniref:Uncharacterized protein n=1 Tax=Glossina pallidipes TaxID=7398 RepID=A0A1A9ZDJ4_GLOPL